MKIRPILKTILFVLFTITLYVCSEKVDPTSPYNENYAPENWMPKNLELAQEDLLTINLFWEQDDDNIDGFKIDRKVGSSEWEIPYETLDKTQKNYTDIAAVPTLKHTYNLD